MLRLRLSGLLFVCALCALALAAMAGAAGTPDQTQLLQNSTTSLQPGIPLAETYTAGRSGKLTRVDLGVMVGLGLSSDATVQIETTALGLPTGTVLATGTIPLADLAPFVPVAPMAIETVNFASPATVTAGTQYALVVSDSAGTDYVADQNTDAYAGGVAYYNFGGWNALNGGGWDLAFQTYVGVAAAAAPEEHRVGYCSVAGNTWDDGTPITPGTFMNLEYGQPSTDANFKGAAPANYVKGKGITCDSPPAGYSLQGTYDGPEGPSGFYPYYAPASS